MHYSRLTSVVVGTGFIGPVHVEGIRRLGIRVKGILGSTPAKTARARQHLGLEMEYEDIDAIIADPEVDAIHLAVPNVLHYPMAKKALLGGKHVMCEKPLAMNSQETTELVKLAKESGLVAAVTYNIRFYPLNMEARQRVQEGAVGNIYSVVGSYVQDWLLYDTDYNWRVLAEHGGPLRAVSDIGTHWMDLITSITGLKIVEVFADLHIVHPLRKRPLGEVETFSGKMTKAQSYEEVEINTEDCGSILFRFENGAKGVLWVSQVMAGCKNNVSYQIAGSQQSLQWDSARPNELWVGHRSSPNQIVVKDPSLVSELARTYIDYPGQHNEGFPDSFKQCFRSFYNAILEHGEVDYPTFKEGHYEVALCDAILESHRRQAWTRVDA
ncbi:MAG: Gfo/Idh/MocA family oxidoreductase [Saprospiraceae bacterium]|nr:Gfo/Idh/MocA family oxidoreductase [Saprospiraceae bacterium]